MSHHFDLPLPRGFTCKCGLINEFPQYVFEHWHDLLVFTCACGQKYSMLSGRIRKAES